MAVGELCIFTLTRAAVIVSDSVTDKHQEAICFLQGDEPLRSSVWHVLICYFWFSAFNSTDGFCTALNLSLALMNYDLCRVILRSNDKVAQPRVTLGDTLNRPDCTNISIIYFLAL